MKVPLKEIVKICNSTQNWIGNPNLQGRIYFLLKKKN